MATMLQGNSKTPDQHVVHGRVKGANLMTSEGNVWVRAIACARRADLPVGSTSIMTSFKLDTCKDQHENQRRNPVLLDQR